MRTRIITAIVALVFGVLGMALAFVGSHLWQDHARLHEILGMVDAAKAQQAAQRPAAPPQAPPVK